MLVSNPALGTAANGLLIQSAGIGCFCFAGATNTAPAPLHGDGAAVTGINAFGDVLVTDTNALAAPFVQFSSGTAGTVYVTAVSITGNLTVINT